jgi:hypothetical protein
VIEFIVSDRSPVHNFPMHQGAKDELLPWVVGGVLLIATTIAVAAIAGSADGQAESTAMQSSDNGAPISSAAASGAATAPFKP